MKVKLATQLLSMNVAKALTLCDEVLNSTQFKDSSATVNFITLLNNFFDVMNSRKFNFYGLKRSVDNQNKSDIFSFLNKVKSYILELKCHVKSQKTIKRRNQMPKITLHIFKNCRVIKQDRIRWCYYLH